MKYKNVKIFALSALFFFVPAFAAQEGIDISEPEMITVGEDLRENQSEYKNADNFTYIGDEPVEVKKSNKAAIAANNAAAAKAAPKNAANAAPKNAANAAAANTAALSKKAGQLYKKYSSNKHVIKARDICKAGWKKTKKFISGLPGIRHYNNSIYSNKNYKKEMNKMGKEYTPHLKKSAAH
ncbi:MAG: hypothetical protein LBQ47_06185 [Endomicrobium sp.]|jgi:hypothetical protein|nr:hypothetical protein [Endomicrobium sp.]